jgi:endoglucanase
MLLSFITPYIFLCAVWAKILYAGVNEVTLLPCRRTKTRQLSYLTFSLEGNLASSPQMGRLGPGCPGGSVWTMRSSIRYAYFGCISPDRDADANWHAPLQSTVDIFVDQEKINFFRVTFLMERMCPLSFGLGGRFNETVGLLLLL